MKNRLLTALALALVLPAAARAQSETKPAAAEIDPVGKYTVSTVVQGRDEDFEIVVVKREDGSYGGAMSNPNFGEMAIASLKVEGRTMRLVTATPDGAEVLIEMTLNADNTVEGSWSMQGDGGKVTGKKKG